MKTHLLNICISAVIFLFATSSPADDTKPKDSDKGGKQSTAPASEKQPGDDASQKAAAVKSSVRWPGIVLEVVSEETDKLFSQLMSIEHQFTGKQITQGEFRGARLSGFAPGKVPSIKEIIKKYGKPDEITMVTRELNSGTKEKADYENYMFDSTIALQVKKGSDEVEWLTAPALWWVEGLRKKAQQELDKTKRFDFDPLKFLRKPN